MSESSRRDLDEALPELLAWDDETVDEHFTLVWELVRTSEANEVLATASSWCEHADAAVQAVGLDLLGALGVEDSRARDELINVGSGLLESTNSDVRWSLASALKQTSTDGRTALLLLALLRDPDEDVRFQATVALSVPADGEPDQGPVIDALLEALHDPSPEVRDWATFALGVQRDVDTPLVRDALMAMLADDDNEADTPGEAAVALATRADPRIFEPLLARLSEPDVGNLWVEAAAELADPRLLPTLERLKAAGWKDDDPRPDVLDEAIARCSGHSQDSD